MHELRDLANNGHKGVREGGPQCPPHTPPQLIPHDPLMIGSVCHGGTTLCNTRLEGTPNPPLCKDDGSPPRVTVPTRKEKITMMMMMMMMQHKAMGNQCELHHTWFLLNGGTNGCGVI